MLNTQLTLYKQDLAIDHYAATNGLKSIDQRNVLKTKKATYKRVKMDFKLAFESTLSNFFVNKLSFSRFFSHSEKKKRKRWKEVSGVSGSVRIFSLCNFVFTGDNHQTDSFMLGIYLCPTKFPPND